MIKSIIGPKNLLFLFFLLIAVGGCKSKKNATAVKPANDMIELITKLDNSNSEFKWLRSRSRFSYDGGGQQYSANASLKMRQDSLIWGSVTLLIEFARAQITNDSATVLLRTSREYQSYPVAELQRMLAIQDLDVKALQRLLLAYPPFGLNDTYTFSQKENIYSLSKTNPVYMENIELDALTFRMRQYEYKRSENQRITVKYDDFEKVENMILPRKIDFELLSPEKIFISFEVTNYQLMDSDEVNFSIPENYTKIR